MTTPINRARTLYARMNDALGRDLDTALMTGEITLEDIRAGEERCAGCTGADDCARRLEGATDLDGPPSYCRNRDELERLS